MTIAVLNGQFSTEQANVIVIKLAMMVAILTILSIIANFVYPIALPAMIIQLVINVIQDIGIYRIQLIIYVHLAVKIASYVQVWKIVIFVIVDSFLIQIM